MSAARRTLVAVAVLLVTTACGAPPGPKMASSTQSARTALPRLLSPTLPQARQATTATVLEPLSVAARPDGSGIVSVAACRDGSCTGFVWTTTDLGRSWTKRPTGLPPFVLVSTMPDGGFLGVARQGHGEAAWVERSPGGPWSRVLTAPRGAQAIAISFSSPEDGYAFATGECATQHCGFLIERTSDGGRTWVLVSANSMWNAGAPPPRGLGTVPLWEPGLLANLGSGRLALFSEVPAEQVAVSTTGGRSWKTTFSAPNQGGTASMAPSGSGWLSFVASCQSQTGQCPSVLEHTEDGGLTWTRAGETSSPVGWFQLATAADGSPWVTWDGNGALPEVGTVSVNGGIVALHVQELPGGVSPASLLPLSATTAIALVEGPPSGSVLLTRNGGRGWTSIASFPSPPLPGVAMGLWNRRAGWGLGTYGGRLTFLKTTDGGASWAPVAVQPEGFLDAIAWGGLFDRSHGWVASPGSLWLTSDAGATWTRHHLAPGFPLSVAFESPSQGTEVLVPAGARSGDTGKNLPHALAVTTAGGLSWHTVVKAGALAGAFTPSGSLIAVVKDASGAFVRTSTDQGATWKTVASIEGRDLPTSVGMAPDGTIWAASYDGIWLWPRGARPSEITFPQGILAGPPAITSARDMTILANGGVYASTDGGATFMLLAAPPPSPW